MSLLLENVIEHIVLWRIYSKNIHEYKFEYSYKKKKKTFSERKFHSVTPSCFLSFTLLNRLNIINNSLQLCCWHEHPVLNGWTNINVQKINWEISDSRNKTWMNGSVSSSQIYPPCILASWLTDTEDCLVCISKEHG